MYIDIYIYITNMNMVISPKFLKPLDPLKRELQKTTSGKSTSPQILPQRFPWVSRPCLCAEALSL